MLNRGTGLKTGASGHSQQTAPPSSLPIQPKEAQTRARAPRRIAADPCFSRRRRGPGRGDFLQAPEGPPKQAAVRGRKLPTRCVAQEVETRLLESGTAPVSRRWRMPATRSSGPPHFPRRPGDDATPRPSRKIPGSRHTRAAATALHTNAHARLPFLRAAATRDDNVYNVTGHQRPTLSKLIAPVFGLSCAKERKKPASQFDVESCASQTHPKNTGRLCLEITVQSDQHKLQGTEIGIKLTYR